MNTTGGQVYTTRDYLVSLLEKDIKLNKYAKKALIGINLSMVHMIAVDYGYQYAQNIINRAADVVVSTALSGVCFLPA